jgi:AbrB family looped-hinge helix DNA binding protein
MPIATIKSKFQVTIPDQVVKELFLSVGDFVEVSADRGKIVLTPKMLVNRKPAKPKK